MRLRFGNTLNPRIANEPRFSKSQLDVMRKIIRSDPEAGILGLDRRLRPVIEHTNGRGDKSEMYSLLRNGDPAKPRFPYFEEWP